MADRSLCKTNEDILPAISFTIKTSEKSLWVGGDRFKKRRRISRNRGNIGRTAKKYKGRFRVHRILEGITKETQKIREIKGKSEFYAVWRKKKEKPRG